MSLAWAISTAAVFVWLGMIAAISFMEAPLKFRAPNVTVPMCLGIGRVVFRALNRSELLLTAVLGVTLMTIRPPAAVIVAIVLAAVVLAAQLLVVRPRLNRRSDEVLAQPEDTHSKRSQGHYAYVGLELIKVAALMIAGVLLLSSGTTSATSGRQAAQHEAINEASNVGVQKALLEALREEGHESMTMENVSLDHLVDEKLGEARQAHSGRAAHTVYGGAAHHLRQTLVAIKGGEGLAEHEAPGEATLQVLRGHVRLIAGDDKWEGKQGDLVAIPQQRHSLDALDDSVIMLTVSVPKSH